MPLLGNALSPVHNQPARRKSPTDSAIDPVLLLLLASVVALSRIGVGMHFLSDVVVGSGMGALLGYAAFWFVA